MKYTGWAAELGADPDSDFILHGVQNGFDIIDPSAKPTRTEMNNHPSASTSSPYFTLADQQIHQEVVNGNYIMVDQPPIIVSPLGVIPKPDGGVRIIHDCSRPHGLAVNDYASCEEQHRFQSVDDAAGLVNKGYYMAKVDLKSAYRSVPLSKHSCGVTGLKWLVNGSYQYFYDNKLPFGSKLAPGIFHRLSQAVRRIMARKGYPNIVAYLDDFFICERTLKRCAHVLKVLIQLLRKLGFAINWNKVVDPSKRIIFLGIEIDSDTMELRLPHGKLVSIKQELSFFASLKRASKKQLQSLVGKLNWAASVVHGGRVFLRRLINVICSLKHDSHRARLRADVMADIYWWATFLDSFNGKSIILDTRPVSAVYTDACTNGGGGHWGTNWFHVNWHIDWPGTSSMHINEKEVLSVAMATHLWGPQWRNKHVYIFSDNMTTVSCVNKGSSRNNIVMTAIRFMFWQAAYFNFRVKVIHIPGKNNIKADVISRLDEPGAFWSMDNPMCTPGPWVFPNQYISPECICHLYSRFGGST